jgi:hypothetical protein
LYYIHVGININKYIYIYIERERERERERDNPQSYVMDGSYTGGFFTDDVSRGRFSHKYCIKHRWWFQTNYFDQEKR